MVELSFLMIIRVEVTALVPSIPMGTLRLDVNWMVLNAMAMTDVVASPDSPGAASILQHTPEFEVEPERWIHFGNLQ